MQHRGNRNIFKSVFQAFYTLFIALSCVKLLKSKYSLFLFEPAPFIIYYTVPTYNTAWKHVLNLSFQTFFSQKMFSQILYFHLSQNNKMVKGKIRLNNISYEIFFSFSKLVKSNWYIRITEGLQRGSLKQN